MARTMPYGNLEKKDIEMKLLNWLKKIFGKKPAPVGQSVIPDNKSIDAAIIYSLAKNADDENSVLCLTKDGGFFMIKRLPGLPAAISLKMAGREKPGRFKQKRAAHEGGPRIMYYKERIA